MTLQTVNEFKTNIYSWYLLHTCSISKQSLMCECASTHVNLAKHYLDQFIKHQQYILDDKDENHVSELMTINSTCLCVITPQHQVRVSSTC